MAMAFELPTFFTIVEIGRLLLPNSPVTFIVINASAILVLIINICNWGKYIIFVKLFTVHNHLPLIIVYR